MKTCPCCDRQLPATEHFFDADADYPDGLSLNCWRCNREQIDDVTVNVRPIAIVAPVCAIVPTDRQHDDGTPLYVTRSYREKLENARSAARAVLNR